MSAVQAAQGLCDGDVLASDWPALSDSSNAHVLDLKAPE